MTGVLQLIIFSVTIITYNLWSFVLYSPVLIWNYESKHFKTSAHLLSPRIPSGIICNWLVHFHQQNIVSYWPIPFSTAPFSANTDPFSFCNETKHCLLYNHSSFVSPLKTGIFPCPCVSCNQLCQHFHQNFHSFHFLKSNKYFICLQPHPECPQIPTLLFDNWVD